MAQQTGEAFAQVARRDRAGAPRGGDRLLLSIISGWEVTLLVQGGRLRLPVPLEMWLDQAMSIPGLEVAPLTVPIIAEATRLTGLRDPADMLIVATALQYGAPLLTNDRRIGDAGLIEVIG